MSKYLSHIPLDIDEANAYVERFHRHHLPVVGHKFSLGCVLGEEVIGVAIVGRPVSRALDDGMTLEVTRLCTDGKDKHPTGRINRKGQPTFYNAASFLLAACQRAMAALGYRRLGTYILTSEGGVSLKAANWRIVAEVRGRSWNCGSRPRVDKHPTQDKLRLEVIA